MPHSWNPMTRDWLGAWRGWRVRRSGSAEARVYRSARVSTIRAALAGREADFVFLAGDSHAELMGAPAFAGGIAVNGGIGGATAPVYAAELARLAFPGPAALAVLFIGSNDIAAIHRPLTARGRGRFERGATAILDGLEARARHIWIAALPPIRPTPAYPQVVEAVPVYNAVLAAIAASRGHPFRDPFAALRDGEGGWAVPGAMSDGTHLADYGPVAASLAASWSARQDGSLETSPDAREREGSLSARGPSDPACAPRHHEL